MLGIILLVQLVTLSFPIFDFKKCRDLEIGSEVTQGHWKWHTHTFYRLGAVSY